MDFHTAFEAIDTDGSGEITNDELQSYCRKMNYKESFALKWMTLFDADDSGTISYDEYCKTLGLVPKEEVVVKAKAYKSKSAPTVKVGARQPVSQKVNVAKSTGQKRAGPRNGTLANLVLKYSRARMFEKRAAYKMKKKGDGGEKRIAAMAAKKTSGEATVTKQIGGEKNGGTRQVLKTRSPRAYETQLAKRKLPLRKRSCFKDHQHKLRSSLKPGVVLILLAGRHRGKRVVMLRQMDTGLLLVTGPFQLNGVPMRRVHPKLVLATKTRVRIGKVEIPERVNDAYFRREKKLKKAHGDDADIFKQEKKIYEVSAERKEDQSIVDKSVMAAIAAREDKKLFTSYLRSQFSIKSGDKVHKMHF